MKIRDRSEEYAKRREQYHTDPEYRAARLKQISGWEKNNPEKSRAKCARWRNNNPEKFKAAQKKWREGNKEYTSERNKRNWRAMRARSPEKCIFFNAKNRAKRKGIPFNIEMGDIIIPKHCPVLGIELSSVNKRAEYNSPTLDRIVPILGYIKGNIRVISFRANTIKSDATPDELSLVYEDAKKAVRSVLKEVA